MRGLTGTVKYAVVLCVLFVFSVCLGRDPYDDMFPEEREKRFEERRDPMILAIALRFDLEGKEVDKLRRRGYGYSEIIKVLLIAEYAKVDFKEIAKLRDKPEPFRKIIKKYNLDIDDIERKTGEIRGQIEEFPVAISTDTVKGTTTQTTK